MPRDGALPPAAPKPPSREEIVKGQRDGLAAQLLDAEADKAVLQNEVTMLRRAAAEIVVLRARVAELEAPRFRLPLVEPT